MMPSMMLLILGRSRLVSPPLGPILIEGGAADALGGRAPRSKWTPAKKEICLLKRSVHRKSAMTDAKASSRFFKPSIYPTHLFFKKGSCLQVMSLPSSQGQGLRDCSTYAGFWLSLLAILLSKSQCLQALPALKAF